jgi:HD-like signal output (HDOD) protein
VGDAAADNVAMTETLRRGSPAATLPDTSISATTAPRAASAQGERVQRELDHARRHGPLREIVIPPCPELLTRLQQALTAPEPDLPEVGRIASSDVAMAATLVRNANAPLYAAGLPAQTVGQAMNRLGLDITAALMTGFLARHTIAVNHPRLKRFWERAALRAAALGFIARQLPGLSPDVAYTCGLFNHVGIPVLLQSVRGYGSTMVEAEARIDRPYIATENANHRTDHAVVGALVARTWRLAEPVVLAIRLHHDFGVLGSADVEPEVQTLVAASLLAEHLMRQREGLDAESDWQEHGARALAWLQIGAGDLEDWDEALQAQLDAV